MASNGNEAIYTDVALLIGSKAMAGLTSWDYQTAIDMIETTNFNTTGNSKTKKPGKVDRTVSLEGIHDPNKGATTMEDYWDLDTLVNAGTSVVLRIYETYASNGKYVEMTGYINNLGVKGQDNAAVNISASFTASGARTVGAAS